MSNKLWDKALRKEAPKPADPRAKVIGCLNRAFSTADGMEALRFIMNLCEWNEITVAKSIQTGEINPLITTWTAIRQDLYRELRQLLDDDILKKVEFVNVTQTEETKS